MHASVIFFKYEYSLDILKRVAYRKYKTKKAVSQEMES